MAAIDRVMRAYASKHELNPAQAAFVRKELAEFIEILKTRPWREPPVVVQATAANRRVDLLAKASPSQRRPPSMLPSNDGRGTASHA